MECCAMPTPIEKERLPEGLSTNTQSTSSVLLASETNSLVLLVRSTFGSGRVVLSADDLDVAGAGHVSCSRI